MIDVQLLQSLGWSQALIDEVNRTAAIVQQSEVPGIRSSRVDAGSGSISSAFFVEQRGAVGSSDFRVDLLLKK